jgi:hypothetical protein
VDKCMHVTSCMEPVPVMQETAREDAGEGERVSPSPECSICLERCGDTDGLMELRCKHIFHSACLERWLRSHGDCPYCRATVLRTSDEQGNWGMTPKLWTLNLLCKDLFSFFLVRRWYLCGFCCCMRLQRLLVATVCLIYVKLAPHERTAIKLAELLSTELLLFLFTNLQCVCWWCSRLAREYHSSSWTMPTELSFAPYGLKNDAGPIWTSDYLTLQVCVSLTT